MHKILLSLLLIIVTVTSQADQESPLTSLLGNAAVCEASRFLASDLSPGESLYALQGGQCVSVAPGSLESPDGYFADIACQKSIHFDSKSIDAYCREFMDRERFGNGAYLVDQGSTWTLSPGALLNILVDPIKENHQPFMTQTVYKEVDSTNGHCQLEMRVYKKNIAGEHLKPLIMLHGGSWKLRQSGFLGAEAQVSHFTEKGFVVFAPFYRLVGSKDGNVECNGVAGKDIVSDVNDALDWVLVKGSEYGAEPGRVFVTGQSAGAHLAGWLVTHRADKIERGLLLYPPTDFSDFIEQWRVDGYPDKTLGLSALEGFIGESLETVDLTTDLIRDNSFPSIVEQNPSRFAPLFIIHGASDGLVPVSQAARLCHAYTKNAQINPVEERSMDTSKSPKQIFDCGERGGQLHVIAEGDHVLDVCVKLDLGWINFSECPAGGPESQKAVRESLQLGRNWLATGSAVVESHIAGTNSSAGSGGGGGVFGALSFILGGFVRVALRRRSPSYGFYSSAIVE
jgi:acetyl esterase/lipase